MNTSSASTTNTPTTATKPSVKDRVLLDYPGGERLNDEPLVATFDHFISVEECQALIAAAQPQLQRALVSDGKEGVVSKGRTGQNCWVGHHHDAVISAVSTRLSELLTLPLENAESFQVIHYAESQQYAPHFDAWDADTPSGERCMARGGQRLVTCLLYLTTVNDGGGTTFPKLDLTVNAQQGRLVVFNNCYPGTAKRHPHSLHGGMPVNQGEKWACNLWFRERQYQRST